MAASALRCSDAAEREIGAASTVAEREIGAAREHGLSFLPLLSDLVWTEMHGLVVGAWVRGRDEVRREQRQGKVAARWSFPLRAAQ
ncbi:hypothetical protein M0R45_006538 [Rubus argutus]|uniref:Uncharacterized protein n=1 Tax=Rubus argutus TaxID=59490 RepID=A0AAW1YQV7_RUBAR